MCKEGTPEMEAIVSVLERAGRYLSLIRPMDVLDVAIIAYLVYKILCLVRSTRAESSSSGGQVSRLRSTRRKSASRPERMRPLMRSSPEA